MAFRKEVTLVIMQSHNKFYSLTDVEFGLVAASARQEDIGDEPNDPLIEKVPSGCTQRHLCII
jgi:hypothetical protein